MNNRQKAQTNPVSGDGPSRVDQFFTELTEAPSHAVLVGPVKKSGSNPEELMFSPDGQCRTWIPIHRSAIADIQHVGEIHHQRQGYKVAQITLDVPEHEGVRVLSSLASYHQNRVTAVSSEFGPDAPGVVRPVKKCPDGMKAVPDTVLGWICV